jgi:hypothetical protein
MDDKFDREMRAAVARSIESATQEQDIMDAINNSMVHCKVEEPKQEVVNDEMFNTVSVPAVAGGTPSITKVIPEAVGIIQRATPATAGTEIVVDVPEVLDTKEVTSKVKKESKSTSGAVKHTPPTKTRRTSRDHHSRSKHVYTGNHSPVDSAHGNPSGGEASCSLAPSARRRLAALAAMRRRNDDAAAAMRKRNDDAAAAMCKRNDDAAAALVRQNDEAAAAQR